MEKNIGEYLSRKSTEVIAIVACIGLIITIILAAGRPAPDCCSGSWNRRYLRPR